MYKHGQDYELRMINALLMYHFKIDPDKLNDDQWAMRWHELKEILNLQNKS